MENFETYRAYLFAIAYRMLGSAQDAEDMTQETFLRYQATPVEDIRSLKAYLTTIITRLCLDQLRLVRRKRETYIGPWLPEPILTEPTTEGTDPTRRLETQESISLAFLTILEQFQPFERAVFLLREVFDYEFAEIAAILDKSDASVRRSFSRAKLHLHAHRPRFPMKPEVHQMLLTSYFQAVETGELVPLMNLLTDDVTLWTDAGGKSKTAILRPIQGRELVARASIGSRRFWPTPYESSMAEVNGQPAIILRAEGQVFCILTVEATTEGVATIRILANPEKFTHI